MFISSTQTSVPIQVLVDIVHPSNKWELVFIKNEVISKLIIKKGIYYYELNYCS